MSATIFAVKAIFNRIYFQEYSVIMVRRLLCFLILAACIAVVCTGIAAAAPEEISDQKVIHASGTGSIIGTPDRAQVSFSVETENPDVKLAQAANAVQMNRVIDALVEAGIPRDALKTTGYTIYPVYEESRTLLDQKAKTYRITNTLTVTLHDVSLTGEVIDIAVASGINQASSIRFMLSDEQAQVLRTEALKEAVARARSDADTVAAALGTAVIDVQSADISGGYAPVLYENYAVGDAMAKSVAPTPIEPGDVTVTAQVYVTYLIR
jgi:uncharacterized protein YggE